MDWYGNQARRARPRPKSRAFFQRSSASVALVALITGLLFVASARSTGASDVRDAPGLRGLLTAKDRQVQQLEERRSELQSEVDSLMRESGGYQPAVSPEVALAAGVADVRGPGLTVTLDDSPETSDVLANAPNSPSDRLVHQQDIDAVMNALRVGGAEVLAVQGHQITSATPVKCVGNVILVAGNVYSPPYRISAIGPADSMRAALDNAPLVTAYRNRAARIGLTWSVAGENDLTVPASPTANAPLRHARPAEDASATTDRSAE
jgi:uncharacterized protein YlxW (UPF0749 family)